MPSQNTSRQPEHESTDSNHRQHPPATRTTARELDTPLVRLYLRHGRQRLKPEALRLRLRRRDRLRLRRIGGVNQPQLGLRRTEAGFGFAVSAVAARIGAVRDEDTPGSPVGLNRLR